MMKRILVLASLLIVTSALPAFAQGRVEISGFAGWIFSDGVSADSAILASDGNIYDRLDPKDSGSLGFSVGVLVTDNAEVGFMWSQQFSTLVAGGTKDTEAGDLSVQNYHGYFGYNWGDSDAPMRPFFYGGLGATHFGSVDITAATPHRTVSSETQFSTTWGGGVKFFAGPHVGVRVAATFTPTYIKTDAGGWWCDPWYGCYLVGNAQYSNQFGLNGGITLKF
jgi:hypothetical protein